MLCRAVMLHTQYGAVLTQTQYAVCGSYVAYTIGALLLHTQYAVWGSTMAATHRGNLL